jgi:hypothetical protein
MDTICPIVIAASAVILALAFFVICLTFLIINHSRASPSCFSSKSDPLLNQVSHQPFDFVFLASFLIRAPSTLATRLNKISDKWSPYLSPW